MTTAKRTCVVSYRILLYRILSYRIVSNRIRIVSYPITSDHSLLYRIAVRCILHRIVSDRIVSYSILSDRIVPDRIVAYRILSHRCAEQNSSYCIRSHRITQYAKRTNERTHRNASCIMMQEKMNIQI